MHNKLETYNTRAEIEIEVTENTTIHPIRLIVDDGAETSLIPKTTFDEIVANGVHLTIISDRKVPFRGGGGEGSTLGTTTVTTF